MSSEVRRLLLDLDPYGGTDPLGVFSLFLRETADVMAPCLSLVHWQLFCLGSFPACWRQTNVIPIPKGPPSSSVANYRPNSITTVLSKVFERLVSVRLGRFMERSGELPTTKFAFMKGLGTCDSHTLHRALDSGQGARMVQIDFSAAINRANHQGILHKGGSVLSILTQFLSNRSQHIMVDGCWSKLAVVASEVPHCSVLGPF